MKKMKTMRWFLSGTLCLALLGPTLLVGETPNSGPAAKNAASPLQPSNPPAAVPQGQQPTTVRPQSTTQQQRSYQREVRPRRRTHISKGEIVFMGAIAGTSMGIGAIAGGGVGLAIGAIAGGWGAYAGHRIWHWVK
jgi:hypothetical protein